MLGGRDRYQEIDAPVALDCYLKKCKVQWWNRNFARRMAQLDPQCGRQTKPPRAQPEASKMPAALNRSACF